MSDYVVRYTLRGQRVAESPDICAELCSDGLTEDGAPGIALRDMPTIWFYDPFATHAYVGGGAIQVEGDELKWYALQQYNIQEALQFQFARALPAGMTLQVEGLGNGPNGSILLYSCGPSATLLGCATVQRQYLGATFAIDVAFLPLDAVLEGASAKDDVLMESDGMSRGGTDEFGNFWYE